MISIYASGPVSVSNDLWGNKSLVFLYKNYTHSYHIELQVVKKLSLSLLICWNVLIMFCRSRMILLTVHWMSSINPVIRARCEQNCFQTICCHQHISCLFQNILNVLHIWAWAFHQHPDVAESRSRGNIMQLNGKMKNQNVWKYWKIGELSRNISYL